MTPKWITGLVRARQFAEDNAKQELATAERLASRAHARVRYNADRLESLKYAGAESNAATFVASAVALQAAAATHAAARAAAAQADNDADHRRGDLTDAAVSRRSAEELADRARAVEMAHEALLAQRATDEIAASVFRRNHENEGGADGFTADAQPGADGEGTR
jgi:flagellar export protein FliJ